MDINAHHAQAFQGALAMGAAGLGIALLLPRDEAGGLFQPFLTGGSWQVLGTQVSIGCGSDLAECQFHEFFFSVSWVLAKNKKFTAVSVRCRISEV